MNDQRGCVLRRTFCVRVGLLLLALFYSLVMISLVLKKLSLPEDESGQNLSGIAKEWKLIRQRNERIYRPRKASGEGYRPQHQLSTMSARQSSPSDVRNQPMNKSNGDDRKQKQLQATQARHDKPHNLGKNMIQNDSPQSPLASSSLSSGKLPATPPTTSSSLQQLMERVQLIHNNQSQYQQGNQATMRNISAHRGFMSNFTLVRGLSMNATEMHRAVQEFYKEFESLSADTGTWTSSHDGSSHNLWDEPSIRSVLPDWLCRYFNWHKQQRKEIERNPESLHSRRFLVMQCLVGIDPHCGGTSDRLKPVLWSLRVAYYSRRILLIHWTKPAQLEEFLVPPQSGFDWTAPTWLKSTLKDKSRGGTLMKGDEIHQFSVSSDLNLLRIRLQEYHGGMHWYNQQLLEGEIDFVRVFHYVWKVMFTPSLPVRNIIEQDLGKMGLVPGAYTAAHCRVLYAMEDRPEWVKREWTQNALNCASELRPSLPIFFASDSANATKYAREYGREKQANIVTRAQAKKAPLHIDQADLWMRRPPSDFYDGFVDLYLIAQAECGTYNKGGYGKLGLLMSRNASCSVRQDAQDRSLIRNKCRWVQSTESGTNLTRQHAWAKQDVINEPIYYPAVE